MRHPRTTTSLDILSPTKKEKKESKKDDRFFYLPFFTVGCLELALDKVGVISKFSGGEVMS